MVGWNFLLRVFCSTNLSPQCEQVKQAEDLIADRSHFIVEMIANYMFVKLNQIKFLLQVKSFALIMMIIMFLTFRFC